MDRTGIVSAAWLNAHLYDTDLIIIDCRFALTDPDWGHQQYRAAHVPGARYLDLNKDLSSPPVGRGGRHPLPEPERVAAVFSRAGIVKNRSRIVLSDSSRLAFAARAGWLLRYLGHEGVAFLDGGWGAWSEGGYPVTADSPAPLEGDFRPEPRPGWVVDRDAVIARDGGAILVDSRDGDRYLGKHEPIDPIAGHIEGAVNAPWQRVTDEKGYILPPGAQKELWRDYPSDREIIVYCGSGVTACVNLFSLEMAGYDNVKLYPGGWSDWVSYLIH